MSKNAGAPKIGRGRSLRGSGRSTGRAPHADKTHRRRGDRCVYSSPTLRGEPASAQRERPMTRDHRKMNYDAYWPRVNEILEARDEAKASCEEIGRQYWETP